MDIIVIVDLQKAFPIPPALVQRIEEKSRDFPRRIFTQFINEPGSLFRTKLKRTSCLPNTKETELIITPRPGDWVIQKPRYSLPPREVERITSAGIRRALVCGVDTDACVLGVVFSLFDAGVDCEVDPELCWSSTGLHDAALGIIREQFGTATHR
jgi:nicotinamidase-related amidase